MPNITIGRYGCGTATVDGVEMPLAHWWSGWIEGADNDGNGWILFLDGAGRPALYWSRRGEGGAAVGPPVDLR